MKYRQIAAVGGIGTGIFFEFTDNKTLGREESRLARLTDYKDYCKQHIILTYAARLLGGTVTVNAIGKVGDDASGRSLIRMMQEDGIDCSNVPITGEAPTMTSVCFQYPDGNGGNITANNSACNLVDVQQIRSALEKLKIDGRTFALAAPEIPIASRLFFIEESKRKKAFVSASFTALELRLGEVFAAVKDVDLLAVNIDEAAAVALTDADIPNRCYRVLKKTNPHLMLIVTEGAKGTHTFYQDNYEYVGAVKSNVVSTAGAGDALLGGTIAGLCGGLPFQKGRHDGRFGASALESAVELGVTAAHFAVESADSIAAIFCKAQLKEWIIRNRYDAGKLKNILEKETEEC